MLFYINLNFILGGIYLSGKIIQKGLASIIIIILICSAVLPIIQGEDIFITSPKNDGEIEEKSIKSFLDTTQRNNTFYGYIESFKQTTAQSLSYEDYSDHIISASRYPFLKTTQEETRSSEQDETDDLLSNDIISLDQYKDIGTDEEINTSDDQLEKDDGKGSDILVAGTNINEIQPSIASDDEGNLYVAIEHHGSNEPGIDIYRSTDKGQTWVLWKWVHGGVDDRSDPCLTIGTGNNNWLFLTYNLGGDSVYVARINLNDPSTVSYKSIESGVVGVSNPKIITDCDEFDSWYAYIIYNSEPIGKGLWNLRFSRSIDYGETWSTPTMLLGYCSTYDATDAEPDIDYGSGVLYVTYDDYPPGCNGPNRDIYVMKSTDYGVSWNTPIRITTHADDEYDPVIAAVKGYTTDKTAVVGYTWEYQGTDNNVRTKYTTDGGASWSTTSACLSCSASADEQSVELVSSKTKGIISACYWDDNDIYYAYADYLTPFSWSSPRVLVNDQSKASLLYPRSTITLDQTESIEKQACIVWTDYRNQGTMGYDIYFDSMKNNPPYIPSNGIPKHLSSDVSIDADLSWMGGDPDPGDLVLYDVYFGTDPTPDSGELVSTDQSDTTYELGSLNYDTKYYWKIVSKDNYGATTIGPLWEFTTEDDPNQPPFTPSSPDPSHQQTEVTVTSQISWIGGDPDPNDIVVYDVYFGQNETPGKEELVAEGILQTTYDPGILTYDTSYYWMIVAKDDHDEQTYGPVWSFITEQEPLLPDLVITDIWFRDDMIQYQIHNIGTGSTSEIHTTALHIDGDYKASDIVQIPLAPDQRYNGLFPNYQWGCTGFNATIEITADHQTQQPEENEDNNWRGETWLCDKNPPQIISGPTVSQITQHSVQIHWETTEESDSTVYYGINTGQFDTISKDEQLLTDHTLSLTDLSASTTYQYMVTSSDVSKNNITSNICYFTTDNEYDDIIPTMLFFNRTGSSIPYRYSFFGSDNIGIDRVEFFMDGDHIGTSYSAPFNAILHPVIHGLNTSEMYAEHSFAAIAYDLEDNTNTMMQAATQRPAPCNDVELSIQYPLGWNAILYTDDTVVHDHILYLEAYARETQGLTFVYDEMGRAHGRERLTEVAYIEFLIDDTVIYDCSPSSTTTTYPWDAEGLSLGEHVFGVNAYGHDGCRHHTEQIITVTQSMPKINIGKYIDRIGNYIDLEFYISNSGQANATLQELIIVLSGFQAIEKNTDDYSLTTSYSPDTKQCDVIITFTSPYILTPGMMLTVQFNAIPILYEGTASRNIDASITYMDSYGDEQYEAYTELSGRAYLSSIADDAFLDADYLLITNPDNLFLFNNIQDVDHLLSTMAELAMLRNGVLGYYYTSGTLMTTFDSNDILVTGDFVNDARKEIIIGEIDPGKDGIIRTYSGSFERTIRHQLPFNHIGLHQDDAIAVGNVDGQDHIYADPNTGSEILIADGNGEYQGRIYCYQYLPAYDIIDSAGYFESSYSRDDGFAVGNVDSSTDELEVLVANTDGQVDCYYRSSYYGWRLGNSHPTVYRAGDCFTVGDILGDDRAEVIVGDIDEDTILIYEGYNPDGYILLEFTKTLNPGDQIAVGDVWDDEKDEIIIASDTYDRIYVYSWNHEYMSSSMNLIASYPKSFDEKDTLSVGQVFSDSKAKIIIGRGSTEADHHAGEVEIFDCMGSRRPGDKQGIDALINDGGQWARKMGPDWVNDGYLLLIGETEIIPAWGGKSWVKESCWWVFCVDVETVRTDLTDYPYASTIGSEIRPELSMGRIIGNNAVRLTKVLETSINVAREEIGYGFDRSDAFLISSYNACLDGECDDINFRAERDAVESILSDDGINSVLMHNPDYTQYDTGGIVNESATITLIRDTFFAHALDKDIIFLAGHGNKEIWDGGADDTILNTDLIWNHAAFYGTTNPFVYASSCLTGRYVGATSLAEAFLWKGAGVYLGATESGRCCSHADVTRRFFREWDIEESIGEAVKQVKQGLSDDAYDKFWSAIYHVYGDAKYGSEGPTDKESFKDTTQVLQIINISIPPYTVNHTDGKDIVEIPGGNRLFIPERPLVPIYRQYYEYPKDFVIQDVQLTLRSEPNYSTGLNIPDVVIGIPSKGSGVVYTDELDINRWPVKVYEWDTYEIANNTILSITVYPFYYDTLTTNVEFYEFYQFHVNYTISCIDEQWLFLDKNEYEPSENITADIYLNCSVQTPIDLVIETSVSSSEPDVTIGLPLRVLYDAHGLISFSQTWDSTGYEPGSYEFNVIIKDNTSTILCEMKQPFTLGYSEMQLTDLTVDPQSFEIGELITIDMTYENTGTIPMSGSLVLEILDMDDIEIDRIIHEFNEIAAGLSQQYSTFYDTTHLEEGSYLIKGYILYDATSTYTITTYISTGILPETNEKPLLYDEKPSYISTHVERPPLKLSIYTQDPDQDTMNISFRWKDHTHKWNTLITYGTTGNGTYEYIPPGCTDWIWGNTTYTWSVNVTDGKEWTNQTYIYTTLGSRYDVTNDNKVNYLDALTTWNYRTNNPSGYPYDGLYDVNDDDKINYFDALMVWANRG